VARLGDELFYVTTTSTGSESVCRMVRVGGTRIWGYTAEIVNVTAPRCVESCRPQARDALAQLTDADVSNEAFKYLDAKEIRVAGVPCLALRIGFVGELGYELHCAASVGEHLWDALVAAVLGRSGSSAARASPREGTCDRRPGHRLESNLIAAGMPWIVKQDKDDFVGKWPFRMSRCVSVWSVSACRPVSCPGGAQVVRDGAANGPRHELRVSERLGKVIGLAWVEPERAEEGETIAIRIGGVLHDRPVTLAAVLRPRGSVAPVVEPACVPLTR